MQRYSTGQIRSQFLNIKQAKSKRNKGKEINNLDEEQLG